MSLFIRNVFLFTVAILVLLVLAFVYKTERRAQLPAQCYTDFLNDMDDDLVTTVEMTGHLLQVATQDGKRYETVAPQNADTISQITAKGIRLTINRDYSFYIWVTLLFIIFMILVFIGWSAFLKRGEQTGQNVVPEKFGRTKRSIFRKDGQVSFKDVAGISEAKAELQEIIAFLKDPTPFKQIGASIPKGVLLQGPPGTGKTLLAKAIAGESGVPFFSISGSDFVETFVGVGASRVRDLFKEARSHAPCIIFIDEIDAVGASRANSASMGGQDERGQTLNALLVEMDGFSSGDTVLLVAATNRPDILDPALLRPGRFDRQITILPPDIKGREKILQVHGAKIRMDATLSLMDIARMTPGFSGAELANLVNESALLAVRSGRTEVIRKDFDRARDRILLGIERKGMVLSDNDKQALAHHEAGHTIIAHMLPDADPIQKVTIIPRGQALGQTQQLPLADQYSYTRDKLLTRITILMGGRVAEEIAFGTRSTGAQDDLLQATELAVSMVCKWGMADQLPPRAYIKDAGGFLGGAMGTLLSSDSTEQAINAEVDQLLESCHQKAHDILSNRQEFLLQLAALLIQKETLQHDEIALVSAKFA